MMLPTDDVEVMGSLYKIVLVSKLIGKEKAEGMTNFQERTVYLAEELDIPQARVEALIHEVVHIYLLKQGCDTENETAVILITTALIDFYRRNPELARCIIDMCCELSRGEEDDD